MVQSAGQTVIHLLSDGLIVSDFRSSAFQQLLPGLNTWDEGDLVVARDGYLAGMDMLWTESPRQSDALLIRMRGGQIRKDLAAYNSIRETPFRLGLQLGKGRPAFDAVDGLVIPGVVGGGQHPFEDKVYSFETSASTHGTRIEIKHYMTYTSTLNKSNNRLEGILDLCDQSPGNGNTYGHGVPIDGCLE